ncbi:iron-containing alcohol dehydrogenase [Oceaniglobus trochenteri]|uniref:iron-containing alcohol dehydrogenase n=1 Tax=Oceaniglobus trochenteri TaxID=2763260 RepID=UPI001CFFE450|nr:iron-containing alcohol dehydrogenase [Oceaniglobus trochenteri]
MTLITYPTRVHFADGVLEEALRSELERQGHRHPLLLCDATLEGSVFQERVLAGVPRHSGRVAMQMGPLADPRAVIRAVEEQHAERPIDVIVAFGSSRAIEVGRKCRRALSTDREARLDLFAVPGADGMPDPCTRNLESWRMGLPSILICDPTLTLHADRRASQAASVLSLARCLESYLAVAFNPPADGMALDGFLRCIRNIHRLNDSDDGLAVRRDLMAACLNAMLAQEKGLGPAQLLARALGAGPEPGAVARLILPGILAAVAPDGEKPAALCSMMGCALGLAEGMRDFLEDLPMQRSLSDMGVGADDIDRAAEAMEGRSDLPPAAARDILESVF